jgi:hypothetical protein
VRKDFEVSADRQAVRLMIVAASVAAAMMSTALPVYAGGFADAQGPGLPLCSGTAPAPHAANVFDADRTDPPIPQRRSTPRRGRRTRTLSALSAHIPGSSIRIVNVARTFLNAPTPVSDRDPSDDDDGDAPPANTPGHNRADDYDLAAVAADQDTADNLDDDDDDADGVIVISATNHASIVCEQTSHEDVRPIVTIPLYVCADTPRRC